MPICKRANFESAQPTKNYKNDTFNDNDEVFFCEVTKEIFRDYEDYFRHVMVINSTVWQCEATGRENLTYAEALKSEKRARKKMEEFKDSLRAPVMLVIDSAKQSSMNTLSTIVSKFLRKRYFLNESVNVIKSPNYEYKVVEIKLPDGSTPSSSVVYDETENLIYKVQRINGKDPEKDIISVPFGGIRRKKMEFTMESLQMFIKHNVTRVDGILRPKPESYKKYVADNNIFFKSIFIGKMPHFTPAKIKRPTADVAPGATAAVATAAAATAKKQSTMNKYLVKKQEEANAKAKISAEEKEKEKAERAEQKAKSLKEQMERMRLEKLEKLAQLEKEKQEKRTKMMEKISADCDALLNKTDDLERTDQRLLPVYRPLKTYLDDELVGDAFMIREFMHSFGTVLSGIEVFRDHLNFYEMSRAFSVREIIGPLSDILLILIGTIFDLQREEDRECAIEYATPAFYLQKHEPYASMTLATLTHFHTSYSYSFQINELSIDALTVSEVLRLHLLSSGASVKDRTDKWRIMYRNGYNSMGDPGYYFLKEQPKLLRALSLYPVYQLSFRDIVAIVQCLIAQVLTYSSPINLIEERLEQQLYARNELKNANSSENRRLANVQTQRRQLVTEHNQQCLDLKDNVEDQKRVLEEKLNRKVADLLAQSERERRKYEIQTEKINSELFDFLVLLGMDRAYRKYYVLESIPGLFIEHSADSMDTCLTDPPTNMPSLRFNIGDLPRNRKDLRNYLLKMYKDEEKAQDTRTEKKPVASSLDNKENQENHITNGGLLNGNVSDKSTTQEAAKTKIEEIETPEQTQPSKPPTQTELYMCSGDPDNCIVHSEQHSERQHWSYICQQEEVDALIDSLNPLGERESQLREQLTLLRPLILNHIQKCPTNLLTVEHNKRFKNNMLAETNRKYSKTNYGLSEEDNMNMIMQFALIERILQFEMDIYSGDLGRLKVKDMKRWRQDLVDDKYDPQVPLQWGYTTQNGFKENENKESNEKSAEEIKEPTYLGKRFTPGDHLIKETDDESGSKFYLDITKEAFDKMRTVVRDLASALLQVEQAIERRFIKEPFGISKDIKDKNLLEHKQKEASDRIKRWEKSLMECTSFSQVFLHLNVLHDCIVWSRSTNKSLCKICRRGTDPDKMLLCDECNGGTHMFCMKPKMKTVPEGNWYCKKCSLRLGKLNEKQQDKKQRKPKRKFIMDDVDNSSETSSLSSVPKESRAERTSARRSRKSLQDSEIEANLANDSEEEDDADDAEDYEQSNADDESAVEDDSDAEENEEDETTQNDTVDDEGMDTNDEDNSTQEEDEAICRVCSYDGGELVCTKCKDAFHLECINMRRPPRYAFLCSSCRTKEQNKRKHKAADESTEDDDDEHDDHETSQPSAKRSRPTRSSLRNSLQQNGTDVESNVNQNKASNRRSSRRTGEDLPLNSVAIYKVLNDVMKADNAWPFLRPVSQSEVPDYHKIIKNPMDLAKVKSKLNMGEYHLNEEVMNDIQLVFKNCEKYNEKGNEVYQAGIALEKSVMEICKDLHLPYIPSNLNK